MIREQLYKKTVDILFNAYFDDTLKHKYCNACAVGNLIRINMGLPRNWWTVWEDVFCTVTTIDNTKEQRICPNAYRGMAKDQIDSTGYTWQELAKIEHAFEMAPYGTTEEDWMFNGLVAVLEVLKEIHQVTDEDAALSLQPFQQHYSTKTA